MLVSIFLNIEGMERHATGKELFAWNFSTQLHREGDERYDTMQGFIWLADLDLSLPDAADCIAPVMKKLKERETEINAEAAKELRAVQQRRNDLLMIGHEVKQ